MTTKKYMVKSMFMNILTTCLFAMALSACSANFMERSIDLYDFDSEGLEIKSLEQYSYSIPVEVNVQGDWEIELEFDDQNNEFCHVLPQKGHGPATVELLVLDNWTECRKQALMTVNDLSNYGNSHTFQLMQKCNLDNPEFMTVLTISGADGF